MKKIFVGNLSWKATEDDLREAFEAFGEVVSVKIIVDQYTGKSKGFGFVEMADSESAKVAIEELNGKPVREREMRVSLAQEKPPGDSPRFARKEGSFGRDNYGDNRR